MMPLRYDVDTTANGQTAVLTGSGANNMDPISLILVLMLGRGRRDNHELDDILLALALSGQSGQTSTALAAPALPTPQLSAPAYSPFGLNPTTLLLILLMTGRFGGVREVRRESRREEIRELIDAAVERLLQDELQRGEQGEGEG